ncbi:MAG: TrkH family potassium uptake protein [Methanomassiliicoccus sp.]|nr:TrkH family potassium uptake protein [Methanomassiliicoccus sp.]
MRLKEWTKRRKKQYRTVLKHIGIDRYWVMSKMARKEGTVPHLYGILMLYMSIALLLPYIVSLFYGEDGRIWLFPLALTAIVGGGLVLRYRPPGVTRPSEALFMVATSWFVVVIIGAVPFMMSGMAPVDALFEMMSGFTTTGSTIMTDIEAWSASLLFWRSFSQWLGGAGIIMIFVTVLPMLGVGGRALFKNEFPGLNVQNFSLRIREESKKFHYIYIGLSAIQLVLLLVTGIGVYDSLVVMFSTSSSGGFSPHSESIAFYGDPLVEWIIIVFMFLAGTNFFLHYHVFISRNLKHYWKSSEFRAYLLIVLAASAAIFAIIWTGELGDIERGIRTAMFQVISVSTSTGFASADFVTWGGAAIFVLFLIMAIGGSSGSTAGGIKVVRFLLSYKFVYSSLYKTVHPRSVFFTKLDGRPMGEEALTSLMAVFFCYLGTALAATLVLMMTGIEPMVALSGAIATLSNAGPGIGELGPMGSFAGLSDVAKLVLTFTMWAGRLEFLTVFVILTPVFWRELLRYHD